ncbi:DUF1343 domain-containing protein [Limibacter armeniacum]|uniref:exo-beta-N-acetylmuramidase NamZ family protein n=1 Tax=Limibacter armeniacum TaxID=466084 RepID=UPI002FE68562
MIKRLYILAVGMIAMLACGSTKSQEQVKESNVQTQQERIVMGAEQLDMYLPQLKGKRVGLLVNQTSRIDNVHLVDSLHSLGVNLQYIFAPEHGFRGDADAGAHISDSKDSKTGVEIISIYGKNKKPGPEYMDQLDVVVFDIQDVGARFYTYISSMHYMMEACAESGTKMMVLDRPNPNGDYVDGPILEPSQKSFVGMHPIPIVHGLTVGELALMINDEGWLEGGKSCDLTVIPAKNYDHSRAYSLPVKPSPNLPNDVAIRLYPSICFFEATPVSIGRGTDFPFQVIGYNDTTMGDFTFTPRSIQGAASNPILKGEKCYGDDLRGIANSKFTLQYILTWHKMFKEKGMDLFSRAKWMDKLSGTDKLRKQIEAGMTEEEIKESWEPELKAYNEIRRKYLLYPDFE